MNIIKTWSQNITLSRHPGPEATPYPAVTERFISFYKNSFEVDEQAPILRLILQLWEYHGTHYGQENKLVSRPGQRKVRRQTGGVNGNRRQT